VPQPGLDGLDSLLEEVTRAGLPVELHVGGSRRRSSLRLPDDRPILLIGLLAGVRSAIGRIRESHLAPGHLDVGGVGSALPGDVEEDEWSLAAGDGAEDRRQEAEQVGPRRKPIPRRRAHRPPSAKTRQLRPRLRLPVQPARGLDPGHSIVIRSPGKSGENGNGTGTGRTRWLEEIGRLWDRRRKLLRRQADHGYRR
jgi:hypothetical protein